MAGSIITFGRTDTLFSQLWASTEVEELQRAIALVSTSVTLETLRTVQTFSECTTLIEQMHLLEVPKKLDDQLEKMAKTGQNRSFCTDVTLSLNDPNAEPA